MRYSRNSKTLAMKYQKLQKRITKGSMRPLTPPESLRSIRCFQEISLTTPEAIQLSKLFLEYENLVNCVTDILTQGSLTEEESSSSYLYMALQILLQDVEVAKSILSDLAITARISQNTVVPL